MSDFWWFTLIGGGGWFAFLGFVAYMDLKQQEDIRAGRRVGVSLTS
jgi:hypothetical protein